MTPSTAVPTEQPTAQPVPQEPTTAMEIELTEMVANLQQALVNSRTIGFAVGILMNRHRLTSPQAFSLLRQASQRLNTKVSELAKVVVEEGALPPPGSAAGNSRGAEPHRA